MKGVPFKLSKNTGIQVNFCKHIKDRNKKREKFDGKILHVFPHGEKLVEKFVINHYFSIIGRDA